MAIAIHALFSAFGLYAWFQVIRRGLDLEIPDRLPKARFGVTRSAVLLFAQIILVVSLAQSVMLHGAVITNCILMLSGALVGLAIQVWDNRAVLKVRWADDARLAGTVLLLVFPVMLIATVVGRWIFGGDAQPAATLALNAGPGQTILVVLTAMLLAPVAEEMMFRGLVYRALKRVMPAGVLGIVATSMGFAVVHNYAPGIPALLVLGIATSYLAERTGRLAPAVMLHVGYNAIQLTALLLAR